jgi:hypothetical protein
VNVQIMRIYSRLRRMIMDHKDILLKIERLEGRVTKHDEDFKEVFDYLKELLNPKTEPLRKIGFKHKKED